MSNILSASYFLTKATKNSVSHGTLIAFFCLGFLCLFSFVGVIFLYKKKLNREKREKEAFGTAEVKSRYQIFYFWTHIAYVFSIFALLVGAIVLLGVAFGSL